MIFKSSPVSVPCALGCGDNGKKWPTCWSKHHHKTQYSLFCSHNKEEKPARSHSTRVHHHSPLAAWSLSSLLFVFPLMEHRRCFCWWLNQTSGERCRIYFFILVRYVSLHTHTDGPTLSVPLSLSLSLHSPALFEDPLRFDSTVGSTGTSAHKRARAKSALGAHTETKKDVTNMCTRKAIKSDYIHRNSFKN